MRIVLLERVENLGFIGDIVDVKSGYARNFLLPLKKALRATKENIEYFETQKTNLEAHNLKLKAEAEVVAKKMADLAVTLIRQASETGNLYGSVRNGDIADAVTKEGFAISKKQVVLFDQIKTTGDHRAKIVLHPEVSIFIDVKVMTAQELDVPATMNTASEAIPSAE